MFPSHYCTSTIYYRYKDKISTAHRLLANEDVSRILLKEEDSRLNDLNINTSTQFTKSDLKTGMTIECKDGWRATVMLDTNFGDILVSKDEFMRLSEYNENLTHIDGGCLDIIKVYKPINKTDLVTNKNLKLIWQSQEKPKNTVDKETTTSITYEGEDIIVKYSGNKTSVTLSDNTKAISRCCKEDTFDKDKGSEIAYYRAKEKQIQRKIKGLIN